MADSKRRFYSAYPRVIPGLYRRVVDELLVELHLLSGQAGFSADALFALGLTQVFDNFMQGLQPEELPKKGILRFDYVLERKEPAYTRQCTLDLRSPKQREIAEQCYERAVRMPHELWKDITISGKEIDFSKDGSMQIPKKGVLNMEYVIQEIDVDLENLDGSHQLMLEWPWHLYVAEQIVEKVVNDEGVVTNCLWQGMHYNISKNQTNISEIGKLELQGFHFRGRPLRVRTPREHGDSNEPDLHDQLVLYSTSRRPREHFIAINRSP